MADHADPVTLEQLATLLGKTKTEILPVSYSEVPKETREWLEALRPEDLAEIREAVIFMRSARTVGRFGRWVLITSSAALVAGVTLGEKFMIALKWVTGGR